MFWYLLCIYIYISNIYIYIYIYIPYCTIWQVLKKRKRHWGFSWFKVPHMCSLFHIAATSQFCRGKCWILSNPGHWIIVCYSILSFTYWCSWGSWDFTDLIRYMIWVTSSSPLPLPSSSSSSSSSSSFSRSLSSLSLSRSSSSSSSSSSP